jgi:hypothetical protein
LESIQIGGYPIKIFLTDCKSDERPFVSKILSAGETGVMDRYWQCQKKGNQKQGGTKTRWKMKTVVQN